MKRKMYDYKEYKRQSLSLDKKINPRLLIVQWASHVRPFERARNARKFLKWMLGNRTRKENMSINVVKTLPQGQKPDT